MTKAKVIAMANKLGCTLEIDKNSAELVAPKGFTIGDSMHYSVYGFDDFRKSEIWYNFYCELEYFKPCSDDCHCK
jgi:hypothetical protein